MKSVKEMIEVMINGETLIHYETKATLTFDPSLSCFTPFLFSGNDSYDTLNAAIKGHFESVSRAFSYPEDWYIITSKKRRVIKDRAKLARVLLDDGYVPHELYWKKKDHLRFFHSMFSSCGDMVIKDEYGTYKVPNPGDNDYFFRESWTEEYNDDE